jgi:hypothetical protein
VIFCLLFLEQQKLKESVPVRAGAFFLVFVQLQRGRVNAVAQAGRFWAIVKDMAQMGIATAAFHLGPAHPVAGVDFVLHGIFVGRDIETGPSRTRVVFRVGTK